MSVVGISLSILSLEDVRYEYIFHIWQDKRTLSHKCFYKDCLIICEQLQFKKNSLLLHIYATMNKNYTVYYVPEWFSLHIHLILTMRIIMLFPFYRSENWNIKLLNNLPKATHRYYVLGTISEFMSMSLQSPRF